MLLAKYEKLKQKKEEFRLKNNDSPYKFSEITESSTKCSDELLKEG